MRHHFPEWSIFCLAISVLFACTESSGSGANGDRLDGEPDVAVANEVGPGDAVDVGVPCELVEPDGEAETLLRLLGEAEPGAYIALQPVRYDGHFDIPTGVTLRGPAPDERAKLYGIDNDHPVVRLMAGSGLENIDIFGGARGVEGVNVDATLRYVSVSDQLGSGVVFVDSVVNAYDLRIEDTGDEGLVLYCSDAVNRCRDQDTPSVLTQLVVDSAKRGGVYLRGQRVSLVGGVIRDIRYTGQIGTGRGLTILAGAVVHIRGMEITGCGETGANDGVGILVDGVNTRARLSGVHVNDNKGRGVWVQGVEGRVEKDADGRSNAAVLLEDDPEYGLFHVVDNSLVGVGSIASKGLIVMNGRVVGTTAVARIVLGSTEYVGDGIGLLDGTGNVEIVDIEIADNARAQLLGDQIVGRISLTGEIPDDSSGDYGTVFQNYNPNDVELVEQLQQPDRFNNDPQETLYVESFNAPGQLDKRPVGFDE